MPGAATLKVYGAGPVGNNILARSSAKCTGGPSLGQLSSWRCAVAKCVLGALSHAWAVGPEQVCAEP
eukprot:13850237-Alexandrium_andersonii.AAC.1